MELRLDPLVYWRLKSQLLELQLQAQQIEHNRTRLLLSVGVVGDGRVLLDDATTTVALKFALEKE